MSVAAVERVQPVWPYGTVIIVGWLIATPILVVVAGWPLWVMPLLAVAFLGWSLAQPDRTIFGLPFRRLRTVLISLVVITLVQATSISGTLQSKQLEATAQRIVSLGNSDPAKQAVALAAADDSLLAAIGEIEPSLRKGEIARRNEAKAKANAPRIAELLKQDRKLDADDVEERLAIWRKLVSFAPGDSAYRTKLDDLESKKAKADRVRANPTEGVEIVDYRWRTDGFGTVMMLDVTLRNDSSVELRDFIIYCEHSGPSGTVMDSNRRTLYEKLAAGEKRKFRGVNMGFINSQATTTSCRVDDAKAG